METIISNNSSFRKIETLQESIEDYIKSISNKGYKITDPNGTFNPGRLGYIYNRHQSLIVNKYSPKLVIGKEEQKILVGISVFSFIKNVPNYVQEASPLLTIEYVFKNLDVNEYSVSRRVLIGNSRGLEINPNDPPRSIMSPISISFMDDFLKRPK